jgi:hypothetical protein
LGSISIFFLFSSIYFLQNSIALILSSLVEGYTATDSAVKAVNQTSEKSTLGDIDALAELKEKMEKGE